jgi:hypothetical protein
MADETHDLWTQASITPIPCFEQLRKIILTGPAVPRRTPRWKLAIAEDFVMMVQPKDSTRVLFVGQAFQGTKLQATIFTTPHSDFKRLGVEWAFDFQIRSSAPDAWVFHPARWLFGWKSAAAARQRMLSAIADLVPCDCSNLRLMGQFCLLCSKRLTDPVSMSRKVGPECWDHNGLSGMLPTIKPTVANLVTAHTSREKSRGRRRAGRHRAIA